MQLILYLTILKPSGYYMYYQFLHSECVLRADRVDFFCVCVCGSKNKQQLLFCTALTDLFFITEMESVHCAALPGSLNKKITFWL
jgi:hypothetical protein